MIVDERYRQIFLIYSNKGPYRVLSSMQSLKSLGRLLTVAYRDVLSRQIPSDQTAKVTPQIFGLAKESKPPQIPQGNSGLPEF